MNPDCGRRPSNMGPFPRRCPGRLVLTEIGDGHPRTARWPRCSRSIDISKPPTALTSVQGFPPIPMPALRLWKARKSAFGRDPGPGGNSYCTPGRMRPPKHGWAGVLLSALTKSGKAPRPYKITNVFHAGDGKRPSHFHCTTIGIPSKSATPWKPPRKWLKYCHRTSAALWTGEPRCSGVEKNPPDGIPSSNRKHHEPVHTVSNMPFDPEETHQNRREAHPK